MKKTKKALAILLTALMLLSVLPITVFAADGDDTDIGFKQIRLVVDDNGISSHWEDENGNRIPNSEPDTFTQKIRKAKAATSLPSSYDARDYGYVTPVKNQNPYGTCWSFSTTSCAEAYLIKSGLADRSIDLSESHLAWFGKHATVSDPSDGTYGDGLSYDSVYSAFNAGGTWMESISTYARGSGPVYERDFPYYPSSPYSESDRYKAEYRLTKSFQIDNTTANRAIIKQALMEHGSLRASYCSLSSYYHRASTYASFYNPNATAETTTNHAITIVGWDDNFSRNNFSSAYTKPSSDGAWLIKNSWGEYDSSLYGGYFWMSYEEKELSEISYFELDRKSIYDNTYQYDGCGSYVGQYHPLSLKSIYGANVFTAKGHETLNRVAFYTRGNSNYEVKIYKLGKISDSPSSGTLVSSVSGKAEHYGYLTVPLSTPVNVNEGDVFSAVLHISVSSGTAYLMTEGNYITASCTGYQSYAGTNGSSWTKLSNSGIMYSGANNVCLKVMSVNNTGCPHSYGSWTIVQNATCIAHGTEERTCSLCGAVESRATDLTAHTPEVIPAEPGTCLTGGLTEGKRCSVCGFVIEPQQSTEGAHSYTSVVTPSTCAEQGYTTYTCSLCGHTYKDNYTYKQPHVMVDVQRVDSTCGKEGHNAGRRCSGCGLISNGCEVIPKKEHSYADWTVGTPATCLSTGTEIMVCSVCGDTQTRSTPIGDHSYSEVVTPPDCLHIGYTTYTCTVCNDTYTGSNVAALGHNPVIEPETPATCTKNGLTEGKYCSTCGTVIKSRSVIPSPGHKFGKWTSSAPASCTEPVTESRTCSVCEEVETRLGATGAHSYTETVTPADCTNDGFTTYTCTVCNHSYTGNVVKAKGHRAVTDTAVTPTCTKTGLSEGSHCFVCGDTIVAQTVLPKAPHSYKDTVTPASCTEKGYTTHTCTVCGDTYKDSYTETFAHSTVTDNAVAPTCTKTGLSEGSHCSVCGKAVVAQTVIPKAPHSYKDTVTPASCTEKGYTTHTCTVCGDTYKDSYTETVAHSTVTDNAVAPTCTKTGLSEGSHCSVCGKAVVAQTVIPKAPHSYTEKTTVPTCTSEGYITFTCSACGDTFKGDKTDALGHKAGEWTTVKAPTCTENGTKTAKCVRCDYVFTESLGKTAHKDANNDEICDGCGANLHIDPSANCSCLCHKGGLAGFFWKIKLFFIKLFKTGQICSCGVKHY